MSEQNANKNIKVIPFDMLQKEFFYSVLDTNKQTDSVMEELGNLIAESALEEMWDPNKASSSHFNSQDEKFSWKNITDEKKKHGMNIMAVNDPAESMFGGLTEQIGSYGRIKLQNAEGISEIQRKRDFSRRIYTRKKKREYNNGLFSYVFIYFFFLFNYLFI